MPLTSYFTPVGARIALNAYAVFCATYNWPVDEKIRLYKLAKQAFMSPPTTRVPEAFAGNTGVYKSLKRYWQVFRPAAGGRYWTAPKVYRALTGPVAAPCGRAGGLTLANVCNTPVAAAAIRSCL